MSRRKLEHLVNLRRRGRTQPMNRDLPGDQRECTNADVLERDGEGEDMRLVSEERFIPTSQVLAAGPSL